MGLYGRGYMRSIGKSIRAKHPGLRTVTSYVAQFKGDFPDPATPYYHGAAPGPLDVAVFGLIFPFMEAGIRCIEVRGSDCDRSRLPPGDSTPLPPSPQTSLVAARMSDWYRGVRGAISAAALGALLTQTP